MAGISPPSDDTSADNEGMDELVQLIRQHFHEVTEVQLADMPTAESVVDVLLANPDVVLRALGATPVVLDRNAPPQSKTHGFWYLAVGRDVSATAPSDSAPNDRFENIKYDTVWPDTDDVPRETS